MSKLFKVKQWLSVVDAAKHLATVFGEEVTEADVLRFALDGELKLSVHFVNGGKARTGRLVPIDEATFEEFDFPHSREPLRVYGGPRLRTDGEETHVLQLDSDVVSLHGLYDLPMIGGERHDIERRYQALTGGPNVTMHSMDGAFVEAGDELLCQLQEDFDDNEFTDGSRAQLMALKKYICHHEIDESEAEEFLEIHNQMRKKYLAERKSGTSSENYYPAGGLPRDSVYVVRTDALLEFTQSVSGGPETSEKQIGTKERNTLLTIIAALCKEANLDYSRPAKTANLIQGTADTMGLSIGESTIEVHLKRIPDALATRMK